MQFRSYEILNDQEMTEENLSQDTEFLLDAAKFIEGRTGKKTYDPEEIMSEYLEQMRYSTVNEVSALRDLEYAQNIDDEGKQRYARLIDTFDRMKTETDGEKFADYFMGVATAPSTLLGFATGFLGKGAGIAASTAAKTGLSRILSEATKAGVKRGAARTAVLEGAIGTGQEYTAQRTREEVGLGFDEDALAITGVASAVTGGIGGAIAGKLGKSAADKADELSAVAQEQILKKRQIQKSVTVSEKEKLKQLDPDLVKEGDELLEAMNQNAPLKAKLSAEAQEAVSVAVLRLGRNLERKPGERITQSVANALLEGKLSGEEFTSVLAEHKLTSREFTAAYVADISQAARTLQKQGELKKKLEGLMSKSIIDITDDEKEMILNQPSAIVRTLQELDRFRLASMTSQLATTVRNAIGGGFRLATDAMDTFFDTLIKKVNPNATTNLSLMGDTATLAKFLTVDIKAARVVQDMFQEEMPTEARRLFFSAASAESKIGSNSVLGQIGNALNIGNTISDGMFKRAMFSASLDRQLREANQEGMGSLFEAIRNGKFNTIDKKIIDTAVDDALSFAYQKQPSRDTLAGRVANNLITAHREMPFIISTFIPFPRFVANQMQFVYEHSPFLPLIFRGFGAPLPEKAAAKQMTGGVLLMSAVAWRAQQDADTKWDEIKDDKKQIINMAAVYGPLAPYMIMADYLVRANRGDAIESISNYIGETATALGTPRFKTSFGLPKIDELAEDIYNGKNTRAAGKLLGDVLGTYTIPISMLKDANAAFNKDARYVRNMDAFIASNKEPWVDIFEYTMHYASRYMPQWNGVPKDERMWSTTTGELRTVSPLEKQITGMTRYTPKSAFESELARLDIPRNQFIKKDPDPTRDAITKRIAGQQIPAMMESYLLSDDYQRLSDELKRSLILEKATEFYREAGIKKYVDAVLEETEMLDKPFAYRQAFREKYEELPIARRRMLSYLWEQSEEYNGMSINEAGAYHWAIEANERLGRTIQ